MNDNIFRYDEEDEKYVESVADTFSYTELLLELSVRAEEDIVPNAKSAILIEASTGKVLYEKNIDEKYAPASMTKMMSLLLIMENIDNRNLKMDEVIKVSKNASSMGGSQIFLQENEEMTVEDLLKGITIGSANDVVVTKKQSQVIGEEITI